MFTLLIGNLSNEMSEEAANTWPTAKEKISQEKRDEEDIAKGIVKFLVDVYDDEDETVMLATILTMVKKIDQS